MTAKITTKWSDRVRWYAIPERMHGGITRYVERGTPMGHFLEAVFSNDLMEACSRGDLDNIQVLDEYAKLLVNQCPSDCYGSDKHVRDWIKRGGIAGNAKNEPLPLHKWSRFADQTYR